MRTIGSRGSDARARGPTERSAGEAARAVIQRLRNTRETLWPPKPKEFDRAASGPGRQRPRVDPGDIEVDVVVGVVEVARGRGEPVAQGEQRGDGLDGAGGAEQVAGACPWSRDDHRVHARRRARCAWRAPRRRRRAGWRWRGR